MSFTQLYSSVLAPFIKTFKEAKNDKGRKSVINDAADAVTKAHDLLEDANDLPKDLQTAVTRYIKGVLRKEAGPEVQETKPKKVKMEYTIRDVVKQHYSSRVDQEIPFKSTDKEYIGSYQRAVTTVLNEMTEEDLEEVEKVLDLWNKKGAPSDLQLKRAKTKLPKEIRNAVEKWKFSSGAVIMCLVAYRDGDDVQSFHVESCPISGNGFTHSCPDWRDGTYENFKNWAAKQFGTKELDSDDNAEVPVNFQKAKDIQFDKNSMGQFILPPIQNFTTTRQRQRVVRGYIGAVYREFTKNKRAAFPYALGAKEDQIIFSTDSVPDNFTLSDPDHLTGPRINALYNHWLGRQQKKLAPFVILNASPQHQTFISMSSKAKGKRKMEYVPVNTDDEEVGSEDEREQQMEDEEEEDEEDEDVDKVNDEEEEKKEEVEVEKVDDEDEQDEQEQEVDDGEKKEQEVDDHQKQASHQAVKIGPPIWKASLIQRGKYSAGVSGSSQPSLLRQSPRKRKDKVGSQLQIEEKKDGKRKRDKGPLDNPESEVMDRPSKRPAAPGLSKKTVSKSRKRKVDEDLLEDKPAKLAKTGIRDAKRAVDENAGHQVRVREPSRVKEFPAGNAATSTSRISFLRSLCKLSKFLSMVDLVVAMPNASAIPKDYPAWASWKSRDVYLPADFHSSVSFKGIMVILKNALGDSSVLNGGKIDAPLLLLGLVYREVSRSMEIEPGIPTGAPDHLVESPFGVRELNEIERLIKSVRLPSSV